jgi:hypothetical protein
MPLKVLKLTLVLSILTKRDARNSTSAVLKSPRFRPSG